MSLRAVRERRKWTTQEDSLLKKAVGKVRSEFQSLPWHSIATSVPGRTNKDCRKRWFYKLAANVNKGVWTIAEDEKLRAAVEKHGTKWARIAAQVETRNGDQCSKRWKNSLDPSIDRSPWTTQEEQTLYQSVRRMGRNWKIIVNTYFLGRTPLSAKNQYAQICRHLGSSSEPSTPGSVENTSHGAVTPLNRRVAATKKPGPRAITSGLPSGETDTDFEDNDSDEEMSSDDDDDQESSHEEMFVQCDSEAKVFHSQSPSSSNSTRPPFQQTFESYGQAMLGDEVQPSMFSDQYFTAPHAYQQTGFYTGFESIEDNTNHTFTTSSSLNETTQTSRLMPNELNISNSFMTDSASTNDVDNLKQVTMTATCTNTELRGLMQTATECLGSMSFSVTPQVSFPPNGNLETRLDGKRHVTITASCSGEELGKLMQMVTETLNSVSFSVAACHKEL